VSASVEAPLRLAMWSGPRNISTAMMRAWENRGDCMVSDEPLYAHYLAHTRSDHPGADEVIAQGDTDWQRVVAALTGPLPEARAIWYQKHMSHHLLPHIGHDWIHGLSNVFLIRDPVDVVASYIKSRATVTAEDIGLEQEARLFDEVAQRLGAAPPVIDANDFLKDPEAHLRALCTHFGIAFTERMLSWPAGPRASDGVWAPYWYAAVWRSTGFETWSPRARQLTGAAAKAAEDARPWYEHLYQYRLKI
jgi:Sulfotransferase domain